MTCAHKTYRDHSREVTGGRLWTCSHCAAVGQWTETWGYYGNIECSKCWMAAIDFVHCSDACRDALSAKQGTAVTPKAPRPPRQKRPATRPAWERKAAAAGWTPPGGRT